MLKFLKKGKLLVLTLTSGLMLTGGLVSAGTDWSGTESKSLPGYNGSAYSSTQTKAGIGKAGLRMHATEAYEIDVRTEGTSTSVNGAWLRDVLGGNIYELSAPQEVGSNLRLHFSSNLLSPATNIVYEWRSN